MIQRTLFDAGSKRKEPELTRVTSKIGKLVLDFRQQKGTAAKWHSTELHDFIRCRAPVAPASCDRILRELRRDGFLDYRVVNRSQALYQFKE